MEEQRITPVGDGVNPGQVVDARQVCVLPSCSCCSFLLCPSYSHSAPFPPPFFPFLFFPPTLPDPFSTVARAIIRPGTRSLPDPGLSAKPRIGVPQKGQIELTGYKLDISSAAFRIKCLFVAHTWTNLLCGRPKKNDHRSRDYTVRTLRPGFEQSKNLKSGRDFSFHRARSFRGIHGPGDFITRRKIFSSFEGFENIWIEKRKLENHGRPTFHVS